MKHQSQHKHTFKRYLFFLIASFVVVLAAVQIWFFSYVQEQIKTEIQDRSLALSNVAVQVASETFFVAKNEVKPRQPTTVEQPHNSNVIKITVEHTPHKEYDLGEGYTFVTGDETKTVRIDYGQDPLQELAAIPRKMLARSGDMNAIAFSTFGDAFQFAVAEPETQAVSKHIVRFDDASVIDQYFQWLLFGTLGLMALGLVYALWLAGRISQPLEELATGFKALEKGEYGSQVSVQGIDDIKQTMTQFNQMSSHLQELKNMEQQLAQQQQLLELNEVTRGLAHTLRNPLNTIGLAIEQITDTDVDDKQRSVLVERVREKIQHLDQTIKTMLSMNVQDVVRNHSIQFNDIVKDVILEFGFSFKGRIHFEPVQEINLQGAESECRAILHTLITNAVEASSEGDDIHIFAQQDQEVVTVQIIDMGVGLDPQIRKDLFKPHVSSKPEGAGMGLFIANRICQSYYKGGIELKPNQPKGCIAIATFATGVTTGEH